MNIGNKTKVASFDIDAQNTFTPVCPDELPVSGGDDIAAELNMQARYAAYRIGSKDAHSPQAVWVSDERHPQFTPIDSGEHVDLRWDLHGVPGTTGFELIDGLPRPSEYNYFVWKGIELDMHPYGACYHGLDNSLSTGVIEFLRQNKVETVICGGLATDYCVLTTVLQLLEAGFTVIVNIGACRGIDDETTQSALDKMTDAGAKIIISAESLKNDQ